MQDDKTYLRLWRRLGLFEVWDRPMLFFIVCATALLSYAFDAVRLNNYSWAWIPVNAISLAAATLIGFVGVKLAKGRKLNADERAWFNLVIAATAMGIKNLLTFVLCGVFGIEDSGTLLFRFIGGATIGVSLLVIYSNLRGAKIERLIVQQELLAKERALRGFRENINDSFASEQEELTDRTTAEILPRLLALQEKVELGENGVSLTEEFEQMLKKEVRPLSNNLAREAASLKLSLPEPVEIMPSKLNVKINLALTVRPLATGLLIFISWWMMSQVFLPQATFMDIVVATLIYQALLFLIQLAVRGLKEVTVNVALVFAAIPGTIAAFPSYVLLYQVPHELDQQNLLPTFLIVGAWASLAYSLSYIVDRGREVAEEKLTKVVSQLSRENKIFEQKLWVAQHVWYTLLHGTVQSALTAAAIRAGSNAVLTAAQKQAILQDLNRAIFALKNPTLADVDFAQSLFDLEQTWTGICTITTSIEPELLHSLGEKQDARLVTNEVLKEAVSNAVKHGQATQVTIKLSFSTERDILLEVLNNGEAPQVRELSGIGSKIFDSVCLNYALSRDDTLNQTTFQARIPLA